MTVLEFISRFIWPGAVLLILFFFRRQIRQIADRLQEARGPGGWSATFVAQQQAVSPGAVASDSTTTEAERRLGRKVDRSVDAEWINTGNTYWLGFDLSNAWFALTFGAGKRQLLHLLTQCRHHVRCLRFTDSRLGEALSGLVDKVTTTPETDLNQSVRQAIAGDIRLLQDEIGAHMEAHQEGFLPWAE